MEEMDKKAREDAKEMDEYKKCHFRVGDKVYVKKFGFCTVSDMLKLYNPFNYSAVLCVLVKDSQNREIKLRDYKSEIIKIIK